MMGFILGTIYIIVPLMVSTLRISPTDLHIAINSVKSLTNAHEDNPTKTKHSEGLILDLGKNKSRSLDPEDSSSNRRIIPFRPSNWKLRHETQTESLISKQNNGNLKLSLGIGLKFAEIVCDMISSFVKIANSFQRLFTLTLDPDYH